MPRKTAVQREMKKRYPERVFSTPEEAENYKTIAQEKGLNYDVVEHNQQYYVSEPSRKHVYWRKIREQ